MAFQLPQILTNMNLFVDGKGYAGRVEEITLPKLGIKTEEFQAGGMDTPLEIDMGMEKLECEFSLAEYDPNMLKAFRLEPGKQVAITFRGAFDQGGLTVPVKVELRGGFKTLDMGAWKAGEKGTLKASVAASFYALSIKEEKVVEIDVQNMKRLIGGEDVLADKRTALGL